MPEAAIRPTRRHHHETNVKETIESIVVAFILAFIFRAFVVEAFLIPTGSMAPTLLGAHLRLECPSCGHQFTVNARPEVQPDPNVFQGNIPPVPCNKCGNRVPARNPPIHRGDRILVLKYLYQFQDPKRWDVVVFKSPHPASEDYQVNYIKRLVGLPGESVAILDGDIYVRKGAPVAVAADADLATRMEGFQIQRKSRLAQDALWRIVHDNDYVARKGAESAWEPENGKGFKLVDHGRIVEFDSLASEEVRGLSTLRFLPDRIPGAQMLTDATIYNASEGARGEHRVADLKLSVSYERQAGSGPLLLKLCKYDDWFIAEIWPDKVKLVRNQSGNGKEIGSYPLTSSRPMRIDLINVDYRVTVRIDGMDVIQTDDSYGPDMRELPRLMARDGRPAEVRIAAENQKCILKHISVWRDVHYYVSPTDSRQLHAKVDAPIQLQKDEFFVLGDNPQISLDARFWDSPIDLPEEDLFAQAGVVPERFMIGKAFFVYWPAGFRPLGLPVGIVPNFGEMRFIH